MNKWMNYSDIHILKRQGFSIRKIAEKLNLSRTTVYKFLRLSPEEFAEWLASCKKRRKKLDPYRELILSWLREHPDLSSAQVFDWLQERYPNLTIGESTVRLYIREIREVYHIPKESFHRVYTAIPDPPMGQQMQVDFGQTKQKTTSGKEIKLYFISFVLSHSRFKAVVWLDRPFTTRDVIRAHEYAFIKFGGIPYESVYDQDHLLVVSENAGDVLLTSEFQSYVQQRKLKLYICRKSDPESKGKIENVVGFIKKNFAKHRVFHNIDQWNEQSERWLERTGNGKVHNTTKKRPVEVLSLEKPHLRPISPINLFHNVDENSITRIVRKDNTIRYKSNRYSVPLGTYDGTEKQVYLTVTDEQIIIRERPDGPILAEHTIDHRKGQLIQDRQHTRDRSKGIYAYMTSIAEEFQDSERAYNFLEEVRKRYPRYIRDQLHIISQTMKTYDLMIIEEAITFCLNEKLYSAIEFRDAVQYIDRQKPERSEPNQPAEIKPLALRNTSLFKTKPVVRDMSEYVAILKGVTG